MWNRIFISPIPAAAPVAKRALRMPPQQPATGPLGQPESIAPDQSVVSCSGHVCMHDVSVDLQFIPCPFTAGYFRQWMPVARALGS